MYVVIYLLDTEAMISYLSINSNSVAINIGQSDQVSEKWECVI